MSCRGNPAGPLVTLFSACPSLTEAETAHYVLPNSQPHGTEIFKYSLCFVDLPEILPSRPARYVLPVQLIQLQKSWRVYDEWHGRECKGMLVVRLRADSTHPIHPNMERLSDQWEIISQVRISEYVELLLCSLHPSLWRSFGGQNYLGSESFIPETLSPQL